MAAQAAFDSCCATSAARIAPLSPPSATPPIQASSGSMHCVVRWRGTCLGRSVDSSYNSSSGSNHNNIRAFLVSRGHCSTFLPRRYLPLAPSPRRNGSRGACGQHFAFLGLVFECERNRVANLKSALRASARLAKGFMVFEEIEGDLGGSDHGKFRKRRQVRLIANAEKKKKGGISFGDQLLDYIEGKAA